MVWANHVAAVNLTLSQRPALVNTNAAERPDFAARIADRIRIIIDQHFGDGVQWERGKTRHLDERHNSSKPVTDRVCQGVKPIDPRRVSAIDEASASLQDFALRQLICQTQAGRAFA